MLKVMPVKERESVQFVTFGSLKRSFHKVFGAPNDPMAELLFRYLSGCSDESIDTVRVNYFEFLLKLDVFWPKKQPERDPRDKSTRANEEEEEQAKYKEAASKLAFGICDRDGDGILSILDLNWIASNFSPESKFGQEAALLIHEYMEKNIRPKYVKAKEIINYSAFTHLIPKCVLVQELEHAFLNYQIKNQ